MGPSEAGVPNVANSLVIVALSLALGFAIPFANSGLMAAVLVALAAVSLVVSDDRWVRLLAPWLAAMAIVYWLANWVTGSTFVVPNGIVLLALVPLAGHRRAISRLAYRSERVEGYAVGFLLGVVSGTVYLQWSSSARGQAVRVALPEFVDTDRFIGLAALVVLFAGFNAISEEILWRGVIQLALLSRFSVQIAIPIQAVSFGVAHLFGYPRGLDGVVMTFAFGLGMGVLTYVYKSVGPAIVGHFVADVAIGLSIDF